MADNLLGIALNILKKVSEGDLPKANDYGITEQQFGQLIDELTKNDYLDGASIARGGSNKVLIVFLEEAHVTLKGLQYLNDNSTLMKAYKGIKGVKDIIPFI